MNDIPNTEVDYKELFYEAFNTIASAYKSPENMKEILEQYLLKNACCCEMATESTL